MFWDIYGVFFGESGVDRWWNPKKRRKKTLVGVNWAKLGWWQDDVWFGGMFFLGWVASDGRLWFFGWLFAMEFRFRLWCWRWWLFILGVDGWSWLGGVCFVVFFGVSFGCSAYIRRLCCSFLLTNLCSSCARTKFINKILLLKKWSISIYNLVFKFSKNYTIIVEFFKFIPTLTSYVSGEALSFQNCA